MEERFSRTELLIGKEKLQYLRDKSVMIIGLGGVGGFAAEAIARAGVGKIIIADYDKVTLSNVNRQILALDSTIGKYKVDLMSDRIKDINPEVELNQIKAYYSDKTSEVFFKCNVDYIIDAIDTFKSKISLIAAAINRKTSIISSMGAGNRLNPTNLRIDDISKTSVCPLAKKVRVNLRKLGIESGVETVYSIEKPIKIDSGSENVIGSISYVPSVAGLLLASRVVNNLLNCLEDKNCNE